MRSRASVNGQGRSKVRPYRPSSRRSTWTTGGSEESAAQGANAPTPPPAETAAPSDEEEDHEHAEEPLGTVEIGGLAVELAQGHGGVVAGKEGHLVVKLPYSDSGATVVRAWIGTEDRTLSYVGKGEYAPSHDDYDVHATAPDPLPASPRWPTTIMKATKGNTSATIIRRPQPSKGLRPVICPSWNAST